VSNSKQIGNYSVRKAIAYYSSLGYEVDIVEKKGRWVKWKDLFSEFFSKDERDAGFDLLAIHRDEQPVLIQVTTTRPKTHGHFHYFKGIFPNIGVEQYVRTKRVKPDLRVIYKSETEKEKINV
jgi:hypothetical protein